MSHLVEACAGCKVKFHLKNEDGSAYDLTGAVVTLYWRIDRGPIVSRTMAVADPTTGGVVEYAFAQGELIRGQMTAEVAVSSGANVRRSVEQQSITVRPSLGVDA